MNKSNFDKRTVLCLLSTLWFGNFETASAASPPTEWILKQGEATVYVSPNAVKIHSNVQNFSAVAKAPDWKVYVFRDDTKLIWSDDLDCFNGAMFVRPLSQRHEKGMSTLPCKLAGTATIQKHKCTVYDHLGSLIYCSDEIPIAPQGAELISRYRFYPKLSKVPLYRFTPSANSASEGPSKKISVISVAQWMDSMKGSEPRVGLKTEPIIKKPFDPRDFAVPSTYKKTTDIHDVAFSNDKKKEFELMFDGVVFTPDKKPRSTTQQK